MVNRSIGQTLSRTILTSLTTFVVVFILLLAGGDAIQGFAFALTIGVIAGTYSSIFIASPVLLWLVHSQAKPRNKVASAPAKAVST
jgi:SecD/SecF fusion protein